MKLEESQWFVELNKKASQLIEKKWINYDFDSVTYEEKITEVEKYKLSLLRRIFDIIRCREIINHSNIFLQYHNVNKTQRNKWIK
jgi:hypothetical protein